MDGETENRKHNLKFPVHIPIYIYINNKNKKMIFSITIGTFRN